jgi:hypothetical protein
MLRWQQGITVGLAAVLIVNKTMSFYSSASIENPILAAVFLVQHFF